MKKENTFFMNRQTSKWKTLLLSSLFFFFVFAVNAQDYCEPSSEYGDYLSSIEINSTLGDISYTVSSQPNNPTKGYDDLSATETLDVIPGETIEVNTLYVGGFNTVKIWVDWDNNGVFDEDELMDENYVSSASTLNELSFDIPDSANGEYRIRVRGRYSTTAFNACDEISFGSAVDFTLNVIELDDCVDTEAGDIVGETDLIVCTGAFFSLGVEGESEPANGLTRTWQSSPAGEDDWTDLNISTSTLNVTAGILEATDYRYYVGCENGGEDYSEVISVTLNPNSIDCYCEPTYGTATTDYLSEVSTEGAETDISYTASSGGAHFDQTDLVLQAYAHQEFELHTAYVGGMQTIGVWIDWNDNGYFEDQDEQIFLNYASSPQNFTVTIPSDVENGQYRMRIRGVYGNKETEGNDFVCNGQTYGSSIDITLEIIDMPPCINPSALVVDDITSENAEITWFGNSDSYNIEYGIEGFELGSGTLVEDVNPPYSLSEMTPATVYDVYVQANCEDDETSDWTLTSFTTACVALTEMTEDFDSYDTGSFLPLCWERIIEGSGSITITDTSPASGNRNIYLYSSTDSNKVMAVLPEFSNVNAGTHWLKFKVRSSTANGTLKLGYVTEDENSIDDFVELETISVPNTTYTDSEQEFVIPDNIPADARLAILNPGINSYSFYMDDFIWEEAPSCFVPEDVSVGNITTDSAEITWEEDADSYNIEWGEAGFEQGEGTLIEGVETPYVLSDLDPNTIYEFYVQADCGDDDLSAWTGPFSFSTACVAMTDLPYEENFDNYGTGSDAFPNCWSRPVTYTSGSTVWPSIVSTNAIEGNSLKFQSATDEPTYAVSPAFEEDIQNLRVSFWLKREGNNSGTIDVGVMSDASDLNTFELIETIDPSNTAYKKYVYDLNTVELTGADNYIAFRHNSDANNWFYWLDDFKVELTPSCFEPTNISVENVTADSAEISWEGDADSYDIEYGEAGFTQGEGTVITDENSPYILSDLDPNTSYDLYIRSNCGEDDYSLWSALVNFDTPCVAISDFPWTESFEDDTKNCWTNEYVSASHNWNLSATANQNSSVSARTGDYMAEFRTASFSGEKTKLITPELDLSNLNNPELEFYFANAAWGTDIDELRIFYKTSASSDWIQIGEDYTTAHSSWTQVILDLPEPSATYYIAFEAKSKYARGVDIDDVTVREGEAEAEACEAPEDLEIDDITENSAFVIWEPGMDPEDSNGWEVVYGPEGFDIDGEDGTSIIVEDAPFVELEGLDPDTAYDVYVRTICEDDQNSDWSEVVSFTTDEEDEEPIDECEAPIEVQTGEVTDTTAEISWTPQGEETSWLVVYGEVGDDLEDFLQAVVLEPMYTLENLDPATDYEVYVMAICDEEEDIYSDASEIVTFQTGPLSVDNQIFEDFSFYPNPVENVLNLQANAQIEKVEVYNLIGQKVISVQPQLIETQIHTQAMQSGIYLMKVTIDGAEKTFRVIKK